MLLGEGNAAEEFVGAGPDGELGGVGIGGYEGVGEVLGGVGGFGGVVGGDEVDAVIGG